MSAFSSRGGREEKLRCASLPSSAKPRLVDLDFDFLVAFKVYDVDRDGYISNGELFLVLKMMVGNNLKVGFLSAFAGSFPPAMMGVRLFTGRIDALEFRWTPRDLIHLLGPTTTANRR